MARRHRCYGYTLEIPSAHVAIAAGVNHGVEGFYVKLPWPRQNHMAAILTQKVKGKPPLVIVGHIDPKAIVRTSLCQMMSYLDLTLQYKSVIKAWFMPSSNMDVVHKESLGYLTHNFSCKTEYSPLGQAYVNLRTASVHICSGRAMNIDRLEKGETELNEQKQYQIHSSRRQYALKDCVMGLYDVFVKANAIPVYKPLRVVVDLRRAGSLRIYQHNLTK